jgi:hypothetical protein
MLRVLFWNVCQRDLSPLVAEIVDAYPTDVIVTVEDTTPSGTFTQSLANLDAAGLLLREQP